MRMTLPSKYVQNAVLPGHPPLPPKSEPPSPFPALLTTANASISALPAAATARLSHPPVGSPTATRVSLENLSQNTSLPFSTRQRLPPHWEWTPKVLPVPEAQRDLGPMTSLLLSPTPLQRMASDMTSHTHTSGLSHLLLFPLPGMLLSQVPAWLDGSLLSELGLKYHVIGGRPWSPEMKQQFLSSTLSLLNLLLFFWAHIT